jgi:hypothetical protein
LKLEEKTKADYLKRRMGGKIRLKRGMDNSEISSKFLSKKIGNL